MIIQNDDGSGTYTASSPDDFLGWEILHVEEWKPEVKRVYMRRIEPNGYGVFQMVFADDDIIPKEHDAIPSVNV